MHTALLLEPDNEEAMYMLINIELKKSNYSKVKELNKSFLIICKKLCEKTKTINEDVKNSWRELNCLNDFCTLNEPVLFPNYHR